MIQVQINCEKCDDVHLEAANGCEIGDIPKTITLDIECDRMSETLHRELIKAYGQNADFAFERLYQLNRLLALQTVTD